MTGNIVLTWINTPYLIDKNNQQNYFLKLNYNLFNFKNNLYKILCNAMSFMCFIFEWNKYKWYKQSEATV